MKQTLDKTYEIKDENGDKERITTQKNVEDINSLTNHQEEPGIK